MIYFDNAATSLIKPDCVIEAVCRSLQSCGNPGRGGHGASLTASRIVYDTRCKLAKLFHISNPDQIAFTSNATESLNIAIHGIIQAKDHVITTELEHNSILRPLRQKTKEGIKIDYLKSDEKGYIDLNDLENLIQPNTKAIICTHASNVTGNLVDIERIGRISKKYNILFVVDASQTAGVFDIDVEKMNIDILCFTGHKGLMGPMGTGGIYVKENLDIIHLKTGGSGIDSYNPNHPGNMPTKLEAGTLNVHGIAGLNASLSFIEKIGIETIRKKEQDLMTYFYQEVLKIEGIQIYGDFSSMDRASIISLNVLDYDSSLVSDVLFQDYEISTRPSAHCAPLMHKALHTEDRGTVRFSFSYFNTFEEVNLALNALKKIAE